MCHTNNPRSNNVRIDIIRGLDNNNNNVGSHEIVEKKYYYLCNDVYRALCIAYHSSVYRRTPFIFYTIYTEVYARIERVQK